MINKTRTIIIDLQNLDEPIRHFDYVSDTDAIDHNGYVKGSKFYLASYTSGLRVIDILNIGQKSIREVGYFDTYPLDTHDHGIVNANNRWGDPGGHDGNKGQNSPFFNGAWSVYPNSGYSINKFGDNGSEISTAWIPLGVLDDPVPAV